MRELTQKGDCIIYLHYDETFISPLCAPPHYRCSDLSNNDITVLSDQLFSTLPALTTLCEDTAYRVTSDTSEGTSLETS